MLQPKNILAPVAVAALMVGLFALLYTSRQQFSPVYDEVANIPSGYNFLTTGRYTDATHPPLLRYIMSVPQFLTHADPLPNDSTALYRWQDYGVHFLFNNNQSWQQLTHDARAVNIGLTMVLLWVVYRYTRRKLGLAAGLAALVFLGFEPSLMAHGQLATLDIGFALSYVLAAFSIEAFIRQPDRRRFWLLHLGLGTAFMCKFAALPIFFAAIVGILYFKKQQNIRLKPFWWSPVIFSVLIFATYGFQLKSPSEDTQIVKARDKEKIQAQLDQYAAKLGTTREKMLGVSIPAYDFLKGFGMQVFHAMFQDMWERKENFQYLDGQYQRRGWRTYFFWSFLYKSTLATIALVVLLKIMLWVQRRRERASGQPVSIMAVSLLVPPVLLFLACSLGTINIGHRYILPVYAFLAIGIGYLVTLPYKWIKPAVAAALVLHVASSLAVWPHHLSYFNELSRSRYYLADSNIDWGQDLLFLKKDREEQAATGQITGFWGDCFGVVKPANLGIELAPIPANREALGTGRHLIYLSVHRFLNRSSVHPEGLYPWLNTLQPVRKVGTSILVYDITVSLPPS